MSAFFLLTLLGAIMTSNDTVEREGKLATPAETSGSALNSVATAVAGADFPPEPNSQALLEDIARKLDELKSLQNPLRINSPQRNPSPRATTRVTLRTCFDALCLKMDWSKKTRADYERLVLKWEEHHSGLDPDVREIRDNDFAAFAQAALMTRDCYGRYFDTLLRSQTRLSVKVPYGLPVDDVVLDTIPYRGELHRLRNRTTRVASTSKPLDAEDVSALMENWPQWPGRTPKLTGKQTGMIGLGLFWYYGFRKKDGWLLDRDAIDLDQRLLTYSETKCGNVGSVPIPNVLVPLLWLARQDAIDSSRDTLLPLRESQVDCADDSGVYASIKAAYAAANVAPVRRGAQVKWFHGLRASCSSMWLEIAPQYRQRMTLHAATSVVDKHYTLVTQEMRDAVERYPVPAALREFSKWILDKYPDCPRAEQRTRRVSNVVKDAA